MANFSNSMATDAQISERRRLRAGGSPPGRANPGPIPSQLPSTEDSEFQMLMAAISPSGGRADLARQSFFPPGIDRQGKRKKPLGELSPEFNSFVSLLRVLQREFI